MGLKDFAKKDNKSTIPGWTPCYCLECEWKGKVKDCSIAWDSEGWEYPSYKVLVCPNCNEYTVEI